jgi:putative periplasmic protein
MGATIFDVDKLGEKYAFLYNGDAFEKMLGVFARGKITHYKLPMTGIKNVYFYDENTVILLGLGSEILYFDLPSGKVSFEQKLTIASLGGSAYDRSSGTLLISCEGGIVFYFDAKAKKLMSQKSLHKDGIYSVALLGDRMMSGSNDKERSCYYENGDFAKFYNARFAVFAVALSPELGAFTVNNGVRVIDKAGEIVRSIELGNDVINYLLFAGEYLVGSGYNRYIYFWELK